MYNVHWEPDRGVVEYQRLQLLYNVHWEPDRGVVEDQRLQSLYNVQCTIGTR